MNRKLLFLSILSIFLILAITGIAAAYSHSGYGYREYGGYGDHSYYGSGYGVGYEGYGNYGSGYGYGQPYYVYTDTYYKRTTYDGPYKTIVIRRDNPYKTSYYSSTYRPRYSYYGYGNYPNQLYGYMMSGPRYGYGGYGYSYPYYG